MPLDNQCERWQHTASTCAACAEESVRLLEQERDEARKERDQARGVARDWFGVFFFDEADRRALIVAYPWLAEDQP